MRFLISKFVKSRTKTKSSKINLCVCRKKLNILCFIYFSIEKFQGSIQRVFEHGLTLLTSNKLRFIISEK